jgi:2-methylcitrate dehydratase PrpD
VAAAASATAAIASVVAADLAVTGAIGPRAVTATTIAATGVRLTRLRRSNDHGIR